MNGRRIARMSGNNYVAIAFSTMRLALGYEKAVPDWYDESLYNNCKHPTEICEVAGLWFPDHEVEVCCYRPYGEAAQTAPNCTYIGDCIPKDSYVWDNYLTAFSYYVGDNDDAHMVVGRPCIYGDMKFSVVVNVKF